MKSTPKEIMVSELTVTIKGSESTYKQKFLLYDVFEWTEDDPAIKACIEKAIANHKIEPEQDKDGSFADVDIKVRGLLVIQ